MRLRTLVVLLAAALALGAASAAGGGPRTGLYGNVTVGPLQPVCQVGQPCDGPAANVMLLFSRGGTVRARAHTNAHGAYSVYPVAPGVYAVSVKGQRIGMGSIKPQQVRVVRGAFRRQNFAIDTGIR